MPLTPDISSQDHHRGPLDARLVVVHYGDFECPYSGLVAPILHRIKRERGEEMCLVFRTFPLTDLHPRALGAALAAEAAGEKFWEMHDLLFANQRALRSDNLADYARRIGLERDEFARDISDTQTRALVRQSVESGQQSGVHGTPTLFINGEFYDNDRQMWRSSKLDRVLQALPKEI